MTHEGGEAVPSDPDILDDLEELLGKRGYCSTSTSACLNLNDYVRDCPDLHLTGGVSVEEFTWQLIITIIDENPGARDERGRLVYRMAFHLLSYAEYGSDEERDAAIHREIGMSLDELFKNRDFSEFKTDERDPRKQLGLRAILALLAGKFVATDRINIPKPQRYHLRKDGPNSLLPDITERLLRDIKKSIGNAEYVEKVCARAAAKIDSEKVSKRSLAANPQAKTEGVVPVEPSDDHPAGAQPELLPESDRVPRGASVVADRSLRDWMDRFDPTFELPGELSDMQFGIHRQVVKVDYLPREDLEARVLKHIMPPDGLPGTRPKPVLILGGSTAGKSQLVATILRTHFPQRRVFIPAVPEPSRPGTGLAGLYAAGHSLKGQETVIFFDDLEKYFNALSGVDIDKAVQDGCVVVATMQSRLFESASSASDSYAIPDLLKRFEQVMISPSDEEVLDDAAADNPDLTKNAKKYGLTQFIAGANLAEGKYRRGQTDHPLGVAMLKAVVDWKRIGRDTIDLPTLTELCKAYLPSKRRPYNQETFKKALAWACEPLKKDLFRLLNKDQDGQYWVFDYLVDLITQEQKPIPEALWTIVQAEDPSEMTVKTVKAGYYAQIFDRKDIAEQIWIPAAKAGNLVAMFSLGVLLQERGGVAELAEAEKWYRRAAESGSLEAMFNLGVLLQERGGVAELAEAEKWYRRAAEGGILVAMFNLSVLLWERGGVAELAEAEKWYRRAAEGGDLKAMFNLSVLLWERGGVAELAEAEKWYRRAAEGGDLEAMFNLGVLLEERGGVAELAEAEKWYRRAAEGGDLEAMFNLGVLLEERGGVAELAEAEKWYRRAAEGGDLEAMFNLGVILQERGDEESLRESEYWFRRYRELGGDSDPDDE